MTSFRRGIISGFMSEQLDNVCLTDIETSNFTISKLLYDNLYDIYDF